MLRRKLEPKEGTTRRTEPDEFSEYDADDDCFDLGSDVAFRNSYQGRALRESILANSCVGAADTNNTCINVSKFFGIVDKRYVRTFTGLLHAITSFAALLIGNYLFVRVIILHHPYKDQRVDFMATVFHLLSLLSGATLLPFWHKVQSWQLSTTTMAQKGLSSRQMQQFNQGRGVLAPILSAVYPLLYRYQQHKQQSEQEQAIAILDNATISRLIGASVLLVALYQYTLIRDYGKALFIVYGGSKLGFSLHLLYSGSLRRIQAQYPYAIEYLEKEALLVTCCVEFGFLWYYLYSRRLLAKEFVQTLCKNYHPAMLYIWVSRLTIDRWWRKLPLSLSWVMTLNSLLTTLFLIKLIKSLVDAGNKGKVMQPEKNDQSTSRSDRKSLPGVRSSIFEVKSPTSGMRSSIFESISVASRFEQMEGKNM